MASDHPRGTQPPQGMQAEGTVPGPHARTPAPPASGQRTPTAHPEDEQPGKDEGLTSDVPPNGARHPPQDALTPPHKAQRQLARAHAVRVVLGPPRPHHPCPGHTGNGSSLPALRDGRSGEGQRLTPDAPHNCGRPTPRDGPPPPSRHAAPGRTCKPRGQCWTDKRKMMVVCASQNCGTNSNKIPWGALLPILGI